MFHIEGRMSPQKKAIAERLSLCYGFYYL